MDCQEAIKNHINECRHRIDVIRNHINANADADKDGCCENIQVLETAISAMQELQELHDQGLSLERLKDINFRKSVVGHINYDAYMRLMDELEEYKQLGTLEEVQEAVEKQNAQEARIMLGMYGIVYECKECGNELEMYCEYCPFCGQRQKWSDEE